MAWEMRSSRKRPSGIPDLRYLRAISFQQPKCRCLTNGHAASRGEELHSTASHRHSLRRMDTANRGNCERAELARRTRKSRPKAPEHLNIPQLRLDI